MDLSDSMKAIRPYSVLSYITKLIGSMLGCMRCSLTTSGEAIGAVALLDPVASRPVCSALGLAPSSLGSECTDDALRPWGPAGPAGISGAHSPSPIWISWPWLWRTDGVSGGAGCRAAATVAGVGELAISLQHSVPRRESTGAQ